MTGWKRLSLIRVGDGALQAVQGAFSPRPDSPPTRVRQNGLVCVAIGVLSFAVAGAVMVLLPSRPEVVGIPVMAGYPFLIVGTYRAIFGRGPAASSEYEVSWKRVLFGLASVVIIFAALMGLAFLAEFFFGR